MPGFILHLLHGKFILGSGSFNYSEKEKAEFQTGLLIPDAYKKDFEKNERSHFFSPQTRKNFIRVPDLDEFAALYSDILSDPYAAGYAAHLYADRFFFPEYISKFIEYHDKDGNNAVLREEITDIYIKNKGQTVPRNVFFSSEYIYGDYTRLNSFLMKKYSLGNVKKTSVSDIIHEAEAADISGVLKDLERYLSETPADAELKVLSAESLEDEFVRYTEGFLKWYFKIKRRE